MCQRLQVDYWRPQATHSLACGLHQQLPWSLGYELCSTDGTGHASCLLTSLPASLFYISVSLLDSFVPLLQCSVLSPEPLALQVPCWPWVILQQIAVGMHLWPFFALPTGFLPDLHRSDSVYCKYSLPWLMVYVHQCLVPKSFTLENKCYCSFLTWSPPMNHPYHHWFLLCPSTFQCCVCVYMLEGLAGPRGFWSSNLGHQAW